MIIVCWTTRREQKQSDHWQPFEAMEEALKAYTELCNHEYTYSASICGVIRSTDYSPHLDQQP